MITIEVTVSDKLEADIRSLATRQGMSERELVHEALEQYIQARKRPRPMSIGIGSDPDFKAEDTDTWLERNFRLPES